MQKYTIPKINPSQYEQKRLISFMETIQKLNLIAEIAEIEVRSTVTDVKFKNNIPLNNSIRNLKQSLQSIKIHLAEYGNVKDRDNFSNEFSLAMWRVIDHFTFMSTEQIDAFMDGVEKLTESNKKS